MEVAPLTLSPKYCLSVLLAAASSVQDMKPENGTRKGTQKMKALENVLISRVPESETLHTSLQGSIKWDWICFGSRGNLAEGDESDSDDVCYFFILSLYHHL